MARDTWRLVDPNAKLTDWDLDGPCQTVLNNALASYLWSLGFLDDDVMIQCGTAAEEVSRAAGEYERRNVSHSGSVRNKLIMVVQGLLWAKRQVELKRLEGEAQARAKENEEEVAEYNRTFVETL